MHHNYRVIIPLNQVIDHEACGVQLWSGLIDIDDMIDVMDSCQANPSKVIEATGISKCTPPDTFNKDLGYDIAYWRAVRRMADKQIKLCEGIIRDNDNIREAKAKNSSRTEKREKITKKIKLKHKKNKEMLP